MEVIFNPLDKRQEITSEIQYLLKIIYNPNNDEPRKIYTDNFHFSKYLKTQVH